MLRTEQAPRLCCTAAHQPSFYVPSLCHLTTVAVLVWWLVARVTLLPALRHAVEVQRLTVRLEALLAPLEAASTSAAE